MTQSRIQSDPLRRIVIALLMICLLAGTTAAAWWLSEQGRQFDPPEAVTRYQIGVFSIAAPEDWLQQQRSPRVLTLTDPTGQEIQLRVIETVFRTATDPATVLQIMSRQRLGISEITRWSNPERGRTDQYFYALSRGVTSGIRTSDGAQVLQAHHVMVLTMDGHRHLVMHRLTGGPAHRGQLSQMKWFAQTVSDVRYQVTPDSEITMGPLKFKLPESITALIPIENSPAQDMRLITREGSTMVVMQLRGIGFVPDAPAETVTMETLKSDLVAYLGKQFNIMTGRPPAEAEIVERPVNDQAYLAYSVAVTPTQSTVREEIWAIALNNQVGLVVALAAEQSKFDEARTKLTTLLAELDFQDDADSLPMPADEQNPADYDEPEMPDVAPLEQTPTP